MSEFRVFSRHWPSGFPLGGIDNLEPELSVPVNVPPKTDPPIEVIAGPTIGALTFLFWNTGRHLTNKRKVHWTFNSPSWQQWDATKWYGEPSGGPNGQHRVRTDAFSLSEDSAIKNLTPIDPGSSDIPAGAWPMGGDDHAIDTALGAVKVMPFGSLSSQFFCGWQALVDGGDPTGAYDEGDEGVQGSFGGEDFFKPVLTVGVDVAKGNSATLLAAYAQNSSRGGGRGVVGLADVHLYYDIRYRIPPIGDPFLPDFLKAKVLPGIADRPGAGFALQHIIDRAPGMSREELIRSMRALESNVGLEKAVISALESQLKRNEEGA